MPNADAVQKAIEAHTAWKARLRTAVANGKFELDPSSVRVDNRCDFGKWLYGSELSMQEKGSEHYRKVKTLHAQFHDEAAKIIDWATSGQKDKATESMTMGGKYAKVSHDLTEAMVKWRQDLQ